MASSSGSGLHWTAAAGIDLKNKTVIFLHAAWMSSSMFDDTITHLSSQLQDTNLVCVDLHGHGKTVNSKERFTYCDQADDVAHLMVCIYNIHCKHD